MWPKILKMRLFFVDEKVFDSAWDKWVARVRGLIMALGAAMTAYGDQFAANLPQQWAGRVKLGGVVLMGLSLMLRAGDKTPANVRALADDMKANPVPLDTQITQQVRVP